MECHEDNDQSLNIKLEIFKYNGTMIGDEFYNWLNVIKKHLRIKDRPITRK